METYHVIGLMSGTSLDGVDLAYTTFTFNKSWSFKIERSKFIPYPNSWKDKLSNAFYLSKAELQSLDISYGEFLGSVINDFKKDLSGEIDFIASHGHTIFHKPEENYTLQIGDGNQIAQLSNLPVVYDFRSLDVSLNGQGAPLVPIGDKLLFHMFDYCINLGGFANISTEHNDNRIAYDICAVNMVLNYLSNKLGKCYDQYGEIGKQGAIDSELLNALNRIDFYSKPYPKSLGREWVEKFIFPILNSSTISVEDQMRTYYEHITIQIKNCIIESNAKTLVTGGGAHNQFLISLLQKKGINITIPDDEIIDFKEAMIFAFLGVLRWRNEINCISSVTGASRDSSGGKIVNP